MGRVESLRTENKLKKTEIGKIPVDWEVAKVQDVCEKPEYGYTVSTTEKPIGPKFLRISDIQDGKVNWEKVPFCHCPNSIKEKYILKPGDILFARTGATTEKSYIIKKCPEAIFASYLVRVVTKGIINSNFLYLVFNSFIYWRQIKEQIGGSAQGGVNASSLSSIKIPLPPLREQKKIAEILTSMDETIEKKQEIIEKTKMLKKGLMQELLTRGIGHKKFKKTEIGEIPVDWEVAKVQDVCEKPEYGYTVSTTEKPIGPKFLRISDIQDGKVNWEKVPFCHCPNSIKEKYILKPGDILFARTGATTEKSYIIKKCPEAIFASYLVRVVTKGIINSNFLYLVFNSFIYWRQIKEQIGGSAQGGVNASSLSSIKIPLPPLSEQIKIAEILTSVDEEIENEMAHKERLEGIKKGLMQVLLTGKIRAKI